MLVPVLNKREIAKAQSHLLKMLNAHETYHKDVTITFPSGSYWDTVSYSKKLNIWWNRSVNKRGNNYYNTFCTGEPSENKGNNITVGIHIEGGSDSRMSAGLWATDEKDNMWFCHSGRIGGGRKGIGKNSFWNFYEGPKSEVDFDYDEFPYATIGKLTDKNFPKLIANFVQSVAEIKSIITSKSRKEKIKIHKYSPEYTGTRDYDLPEKGHADVTHGYVVDKLKNILATDFDIESASNRYVDLYTIKTKRNPRINFEIKTGLSRQQVYTAIGQLILNSCNDKPQPKLVFVCLDKINSVLVTDLKKFKIKVLTYKWEKQIPIFLNLNSIID
jgi:hypothetical protein